MKEEEGTLPEDGPHSRQKGRAAQYPLSAVVWRLSLFFFLFLGQCRGFKRLRRMKYMEQGKAQANQLENMRERSNEDLNYGYGKDI